MKAKNKISTILPFCYLPRVKINEKLIGSGSDFNIYYFSRARAVLYHILKDLRQVKDGVVLMSSYTLPDLHNVISMTGVEVRYLDNEKRKLAISVDELETKIDSSTIAIILTGYNSRPVHLLRYIKEKYPNVVTIEDAAISFVPSIIKEYEFIADYTLLSFSSFKLINSYWGGACVCKDYQFNLNGRTPFLPLFEQIRKSIKYQLFSSDLSLKIISSNKFLKNYYIRGVIETTFRRSETNVLDKTFVSKPNRWFYLNIAFSISKVQNRFIKRNCIWNIYYQSLSDLLVTEYSLVYGLSYRFFPLMVGNETKVSEIRRKAIVEMNIDLLSSPYSSLPGELGRFGYDNSVELSSQLVCLPIHESISEDYARNVVKFILENKSSFYQFAP